MKRKRASSPRQPIVCVYTNKEDLNVAFVVQLAQALTTRNLPGVLVNSVSHGDEIRKTLRDANIRPNLIVIRIGKSEKSSRLINLVEEIRSFKIPTIVWSKHTEKHLFATVRAGAIFVPILAGQTAENSIPRLVKAADTILQTHADDWAALRTLR